VYNRKLLMEASKDSAEQVKKDEDEFYLRY